MLKNNIRGSYGLGGITGYMVDMLNAGCFASASAIVIVIACACTAVAFKKKEN